MNRDWYEFYMGTWQTFWGCPLPAGAKALGIISVNQDQAALLKMGNGYFRAYHGVILPLDKRQVLCALLPFAMTVHGHSHDEAAFALRIARTTLTTWKNQRALPTGLYEDMLEKYVNEALEIAERAEEEAQKSLGNERPVAR